MMSRKREIAESFGDRAGYYEQNAGIQLSVAERLAGYLPEITAPRVLEIGAGTGFLSGFLLKKYPEGRFTISDISERMLAVCRGKFKDHANCSFELMDGEYPAACGSFDLVVSSMALQWFGDAEAGLERQRALLSEGGQVFYAMPGPESFREWRQASEAAGVDPGLLDCRAPPGVFAESMERADYADALKFLRSLSQIGAGVPREGYAPSNNLVRACRHFDAHFQGKITWHILYGRLDSSRSRPSRIPE